MKHHPRSLLLCALLAVPGLAAATAHGPAPAQDPSPDAVDLVIQRLTDPDPDRAHDAMVALIRGGPASAPVLRRALERSAHPELTARARRALAICTIDAPVDHGLKVGLRADRESVADGDPVTFTATLCNVSDEPISIYLGMSYAGTAFENGTALARVIAGEASGTDHLVHAGFGGVGFCGTGAQALVVTLAPWTAQEFVLRGHYRTSPAPNSLPRTDGPHLDLGLTFLPLAADDIALRLRLDYAVDDNPRTRRARDGETPDWTGRLRSNEVALRLR